MNGSLKVLIIAQYFPPDMGGASARAFNVAKGLVKFGNSVVVVTAFPHYPKGDVPERYRGRAFQYEQMGDICVWRVWIPAMAHDSYLKRITLHLCFVFSSLFLLVKRLDYDVIWAANPNLFSILPSMIYGFVGRSPIVRNVDDLWPEVIYDMGIIRSRFSKYLLDTFAWLSYKIPRAVTPISPAYVREIVKKYGIDERRFSVVEVGVDSLPARVGDDEDEYFVVMYSGILNTHYDFELILEAAKSLNIYDDIKIVIRGMGEQEGVIQSLLEEADLDNVVFMNEYLERQEFIELLSTADVFILPMKGDKFPEMGLPTKIFEYQSYGKPIICVSRGEPARYVNATRSGLVVKPGDIQGFKECIINLYRDRRLCRELGNNGRKNVAGQLTAERLGERMTSVFQKVIKPKIINIG